jgi:sterol desaturase/sphingolipid hydroxylase (fatty acid hydroxylase superfamily)
VKHLIGRLAVVAFYLLIGAAIEDGLGSRKAKSRLFNCACASLFVTFDFVLGAAMLAWMAAWIEKIPGRPLLFRNHTGIPFVIFLAVVTSIVGDFFYYWQHRAMHSRWLWPIHELHHSDEDVNVTTTFRFHILESPLATLLTFFPAVLLPRPSLVLPLAFFFRCASVFFIHMNAPIGLGVANRILACPYTHRIHHSRLPEHIDKNFAAVWNFWDVLFGTYHAPKKGEFPPTGIAGESIRYGAVDVVLRPFMRKKA